MIDTRYKLAIIKQQFNRGSSWISIILNFGIITANLKLFQDPISSILPDSIPFQSLYPLAILVYCLLCYLIGRLDERYGIWKEENNYTYDVSPWSRELLDNIKQIKNATVHGDDCK